MEKGKFIVIEGIDGCGGETQTNLLKKYFGEENILFLSFPCYETKLGQIVDDFLHKKIIYEVKDVELLVYYADILQFKSAIIKALSEGKQVITDRYFTSTIAFQSLAGKSIDDILNLNNIFKLPVPDICFLLDISAEESQRRKSKEKEGFINLDRNEGNLVFMDSIRNQYLKVAQEQIFCKWEIIDGEKTINEVFEEIKNKIDLI
ncbi:MAG: dTMP kinase [Candidatus Pacebacteria bacterium]|nr:dTMP kinase [Candidatus Paceibacterota bacterium]